MGVNITSKKPQFSQASFIISIVAALSSPLSFPMSITGKVVISMCVCLRERESERELKCSAETESLRAIYRLQGSALGFGAYYRKFDT